VGLVGSSASDIGGSHGSNSALAPVNDDGGGASVEEVLTGDRENGASENGTKAGGYGSKFEGLDGVISYSLEVEAESFLGLCPASIRGLQATAGSKRGGSGTGGADHKWELNHRVDSEGSLLLSRWQLLP